MNKNKKIWVALVVGFIVVVGGITVIYFIPNEKLSDILLTVFAGICSGALTLAGVAWTLKKTDNDRKEEEKKKCKPYLKLIEAQDFNLVIQFDYIQQGSGAICPQYFCCLRNVGGNFISMALQVGDRVYPCIKTMLAHNETCGINITGIELENNLNDINFVLYGTDVLNNYYSYKFINHIKYCNNKTFWIKIDSIELPVPVPIEKQIEIERKQEDFYHGQIRKAV